jgi:hypothetical protein
MFPFFPLFAESSEKEKAMEAAIKTFFNKGNYVEIIEDDDEFRFYNKTNIIRINTKSDSKLEMTFLPGTTQGLRAVSFKSITNDEYGNLIIVED